MNDLNLVSGDFFDLELPKDKRYLYKYFDTDVQMLFLRYYYVFGNCHRFAEHTGYSCSRRWLADLKRKYNKLISSYEKAKENADFALLAEIQSGKLKIYRNSHKRKINKAE